MADNPRKRWRRLRPAPEDRPEKEAETNLPILSRGHAIESASRTLFEQAVHPWMVTHWHAHDLGIDALVEIARRPFGEIDFRGTGKRFAVQLKATEGDVFQCGSVEVAVDKIYYWHEATEPTLLVSCHSPSQRLFSRWIDDDLITELDKKSPNWRSQKTVTIPIKIDKPLGRATQKDIEVYVRSLRRVPRHSLKPGAYFKALRAAARTVDALIQAAKEASFESIERRLNAAAVALRKCTYEVAITGPSRAGKSTLLNALLGQEISPVDKLPTTAVAIRAIPGDRNEAEVVFKDGKKTLGAPSSTFLADYATQKLNEDNRKDVEVINVRLVNATLEQGVAFLDAPGLHDPSPEIRAITTAALEKVNAVIYVIEVASAGSGSFSMSGHVIDDLKRMQEGADRLFLVLNKADILDDETRRQVEDYVAKTLKKYGIWKKLPHEPIFLSAQEAWKWRASGSVGQSPCKELEDALWAHLLETSATGSKRLALLVQEIGRAGQEFAALLSTRRLTAAKATELGKALSKCTRHQDGLIRNARVRTAEEVRWVRGSLTPLKDSLLSWVRRKLEAVPLDEDLPSSEVLREEIQIALIRTVDDTWRRIASRLSLFASQVSREIETVLQQARMTAGVVPSAGMERISLEDLEIDGGKSFEEAIGGMLGGGLIGLIFGGWGAVIGLLGGFIAGFFLGRESRRKREIEHKLAKLEPKIDKVVQAFGVQALNRVAAFGVGLEEIAKDRIGVFVHDVQVQLQKLGAPVSELERKKLEALETNVRSVLEKHERDLNELLPLAFSTRVP